MKSHEVRPGVMVRDVQNVRYRIVAVGRRFRTQEIEVIVRQRGTPRHITSSMTHFLEDFDTVPQGDQ